MGPMKAIARQLPNSMMPPDGPDGFQGIEHALGPSGSLPGDLPCKGLYLLIQTRTGCIFQLNVPPSHTVKLLKQDIGTAIMESPSVFELYFREEALNDQEPLHEYGIFCVRSCCTWRASCVAAFNKKKKGLQFCSDSSNPTISKWYQHSRD